MLLLLSSLFFFSFFSSPLIFSLSLSFSFSYSFLSCDHFFCFECILEWSKLNPSCPKCKEPFRLINKHYLDKASASVHSTGSPNRVIVKPIAAVYFFDLGLIWTVFRPVHA